MKTTLTAACVAAIATTASAFEADVPAKDVFGVLGIATVSDLAVGVKATISASSGPCVADGRLHLHNVELNPDPLRVYYEVVRNPNGKFALTLKNQYSDGSDGGAVFASYFRFQTCLPWMEEWRGGKFEIESIDGFTAYSDWLAYVKATYEIEP